MNPLILPDPPGEEASSLPHPRLPEAPSPYPSRKLSPARKTVLPFPDLHPPSSRPLPVMVAREDVLSDGASLYIVGGGKRCGSLEELFHHARRAGSEVLHLHSRWGRWDTYQRTDGGGWGYVGTT